LQRRSGLRSTFPLKIENQKHSFGEFPSDELIVKLAKALAADPDKLLLQAEKIPGANRKRVLEIPRVFRKVAGVNDNQLNEVMEFMCRRELSPPTFHRVESI